MMSTVGIILVESPWIGNELRWLFTEVPRWCLIPPLQSPDRVEISHCWSNQLPRPYPVESSTQSFLSAVALFWQPIENWTGLSHQWRGYRPEHMHDCGTHTCFVCLICSSRGRENGSPYSPEHRHENPYCFWSFHPRITLRVNVSVWLHFGVIGCSPLLRVLAKSSRFGMRKNDVDHYT